MEYNIWLKRELAFHTAGISDVNLHCNIIDREADIWEDFFIPISFSKQPVFSVCAARGKKKVLAKWMFFTRKDVNFHQKVVNHWEKQRKKSDKTFLVPKVFIDCVPLKKIQLNLLNPQVIKPWAVHCRQSKWELL